MTRLTRDGTAEAARETKFSGANGDGEIFIFPVQPTTSRIGNLNLTRLILTLAICDGHTYIEPTYILTVVVEVSLQLQSSSTPV